MSSGRSRNTYTYIYTYIHMHICICIFIYIYIHNTYICNTYNTKEVDAYLMEVQVTVKAEVYRYKMRIITGRK